MSELEIKANAEQYALKRIASTDLSIQARDKILIQDAYEKGFNDAKSKMGRRIEELEKENAELKAQIEKMKCCENCGWYYLQQHWKESKEIDESRMFHCGICGNKRNWKPKEINEK